LTGYDVEAVGCQCGVCKRAATYSDGHGKYYCELHKDRCSVEVSTQRIIRTAAATAGNKYFIPASMRALGEIGKFRESIALHVKGERATERHDKTAEEVERLQRELQEYSQKVGQLIAAVLERDQQILRLQDVLDARERASESQAETSEVAAAKQESPHETKRGRDADGRGNPSQTKTPIDAPQAKGLKTETEAPPPGGRRRPQFAKSFSRAYYG
jgi:hypothetical protein